MTMHDRGSRRWRSGVSTLAVMALVTAAAVAGAQQEAASDARVAFEAATIKRAAPGEMRNQVMPTSPNRLYIPSMTLSWLIYTAHGNGGFNTAMRVTGGPEWANRTGFAVEAVASGNVTPPQRRLMLRTLLEERFALKLRHEVVTGDALVLTLDRGNGTLGPKVRTWDGTCPQVMPVLSFQAPRRPLRKVGDRFVVGPVSDTDDPAVPYCPTGYSATGIRIDGATMGTVAEVLSLPPGRALLGTITHDQTGLAGRYTMELDYPFVPASAAGAPPEFAGPSLPTAVREQWGLRIVPGKGPLKVVRIESAQMPTDN
jgi:uncharacterized protein (TIGR03435 family)